MLLAAVIAPMAAVSPGHAWAAARLTAEERQQLKLFKQQHRSERRFFNQSRLSAANAAIGGYTATLRDLRRDMRAARKAGDAAAFRDARRQLGGFKRELRPLYRDALARKAFYSDTRKRVDGKRPKPFHLPQGGRWQKAVPLPKPVRRFLKQQNRQLRQDIRGNRQLLRQAGAEGDRLRARRLRFVVKKQRQQLSRVARPQLLYARGYRVLVDR